MTIVSNKWFERFILSCIVVNCVLMMIQVRHIELSVNTCAFGFRAPELVAWWHSRREQWEYKIIGVIAEERLSGAGLEGVKTLCHPHLPSPPL
jgi:hypothetical protein